jgi:flagellin-specific chaperone FliS
MKKTLQKREKNIQKRREIRAILQMFVDVGSDTLRQFILDPSKGEEVVDTIRQLYGYSRESLNKIAKRFNCSVPGLENIFI